MLHHTKTYDMGGQKLIITQAQIARFRVVHEVQPKATSVEPRNIWYLHPDEAVKLPLPPKETKAWTRKTWATLGAMEHELKELRRVVSMLES